MCGFIGSFLDRRRWARRFRLSYSTKCGWVDDTEVPIGNGRRRLYGTHRFDRLIEMDDFHRRADVLHAWRVLVPDGSDILKQEDVRRLLDGLEAEEKLCISAEGLVPRGGLSVEDLTALLSQNPSTAGGQSLASVDPVEHAFNLLDIDGHGYITVGRLTSVLSSIIRSRSLGRLDKEDGMMLMESIGNSEGKMTFEDFVRIRPRFF